MDLKKNNIWRTNQFFEKKKEKKRECLSTQIEQLMMTRKSSLTLPVCTHTEVEEAKDSFWTEAAANSSCFFSLYFYSFFSPCVSVDRNISGEEIACEQTPSRLVDLLFVACCDIGIYTELQEIPCFLILWSNKQKNGISLADAGTK